MHGSVKLAFLVGFSLCSYGGVYHALMAIHPIPISDSDIEYNNIIDAGAYGILATILGYFFYRIRPKK